MPRNYTARNKSSQPLATGSDHVEVLHGRSRSTGDVEIAHPNGERWNARMIALADLKRYCDLCADNDNVFISQGRFRGRRRIVNLSTIGSLWVDLDYYKTDLDDLRPERVSWHVRRLCDREKLPQPSYIIFSGRGLCVVWLVDELPRRVLPRWRLVELAMIEKFKPMGADRAAADAARVFRLVGSRNSKSQELVRAVYPVRGEPPVYSFDEVADQVLPYTRHQIREFREAADERTRPIDRRAPDKKEKLSTAAGLLWARRLDDLQRLRQHRFFGPLPPGQRSKWLFLASCALTWMIPPRCVRREVIELGRQALGEGTWTTNQIMTDMGAAIRKAEDAAKGKTIEWEGERIDPRYRFKTETIREWLEISRKEETAADLQTIVSPERKSVLQAELGNRSVQVRQARVRGRNEDWLRRSQAGEANRAIARADGVSEGTVRLALKALRGA